MATESTPNRAPEPAQTMEAFDQSRPWHAGDQRGNCTVGQCQSHPEFYRCTFACPTGVTGVELVASERQAPDQQWSSEHFRLQPAPNQAPDLQLLGALLSHLRQWDRSKPKGEQLVTIASRQPAPAWPLWEIGLLALDILLLLTSLVLWRVAAAHGQLAAVPSWSKLAWVAIALTASVAVVRLLLGHFGLPLNWITSLHESQTFKNIALVYGHNDHAGLNYAALAHGLALGERVGVADLVVANAALCTAMTIGLWVVVHAATRSLVLATVVPVAWLLAPVVQLQALSEVEAASTAPFLVCTLPALMLLARPGPHRDWPQFWGFCHLVLCTLAAGLCRTEMAGLGLCALGWHAVRQLRTDSHLIHDFSVFTAVARRGWRWTLALLVLLLITVSPANELVQAGARWTWLVAGLHPLSPSILALPFWLLATVPGLWLLLIATGCVHIVRRHGLGWGWSLLAIAVLFRVWFAASHRVYFEMVRYMVCLLPILVILAAVGSWVLRDRLVNQWPWWPHHRANLVLGLVVASAALVPTLPMAADAVWQRRPQALAELPLLDRDQQAEVRILAELSQLYESCVFLAPIHPAMERTGAGAQTAYAAFGGPLRQPQWLKPEFDPVAQLRVLAADAPCGRLYRGLDCHLLQGPNCEVLERGKRVVWSSRRRSLVYADPIEYGALRSTIEFAVTELW